MKKPVLHGMAARLYPDCGKRFSWSGCVEWEVLTPHIFPQRKSSKLGTSPHIWVLVRCMAALPFFTLLLSLQFVPLMPMRFVCFSWSKKHLVRRFWCNMMQPGLCTLGSSWTSWTRNRTYLESSSTASVWFLFEVIGAKVGETPTEQNQQKMQGLQMRCVWGDFVGCRCRMM